MKPKWVIALGILLVAGAFLLLPGKETYKAERAGRVLFVGDMMFDRNIRDIAEARGYDHLFSCIKNYLEDFDLVVGNLEGPVTYENSISQNTIPDQPGNTTFTFDPRAVKALEKHNIKMVSLGNNHILDFGGEGANTTMRVLRETGVSYFGMPGLFSISTSTVGRHNVAFVSFNQFIGNDNSKETIEAIWKAGRTSDFVVVYAHWGDEYVPAGDYQKALAHSFIDAGADLVIGAHPHVIQETEIYNGKEIYYSLGNFIFDQYWTEEVRKGQGVEAVFSDGKIRTKEVRFDIGRDGRTCLSK